MTHKELVEVAYRWAEKRNGFAFKELVTFANETPDVIAFRSWDSTLIECKASIQDFNADKEKKTRRNPYICMGNYRLYCVPAVLVDRIKDKMPEKWGILAVSEKGKTRMIEDVYKNSGKYFFTSTLPKVINEQRMMYSALRRINIRGGDHV